MESDLADSSGSASIGELRELLSRARHLADKLEANGLGSDSSEVEGLREQLAASQKEANDLATELVELERRVHQLMNLYVATYQLYAGRDPKKVQAAIAEITTDLLGAERFVLLLRNIGTGSCRVALTKGFDDTLPTAFASEIYSGGEPAIDAALERGERHLDPDGVPLAVVPLQVDNIVVGALALLKLLEHKTTLSHGDREILDLLAAHAASALMASETHAVTSRKLRTLESLVRLARGEV